MSDDGVEFEQLVFENRRLKEKIDSQSEAIHDLEDRLLAAERELRENAEKKQNVIIFSLNSGLFFFFFFF
jgi:hypothetical protein